MRKLVISANRKCLESKSDVADLNHGIKGSQCNWEAEGVIMVGVSRLISLSMDSIKTLEDLENFKDYYFLHDGEIYHYTKY